MPTEIDMTAAEQWRELHRLRRIEAALDRDLSELNAHVCAWGTACLCAFIILGVVLLANYMGW